MFNKKQLISEINSIINKHINEARQTQFDIFKEQFNPFINKAMDYAKKKYLTKLGLEIEIIEYEFSNKPWLASYTGGSATDDSIIKIGINHQRIFKTMKRLDIYDDIFNIEAQARITIGHETGHGLIEYIRETIFDYLSQYELTDDEIDLINKYYYMDEDDEEEIVEEFGESFFPPATRVRSSELGDDIIKFQGLMKKYN